MPINSLNLDLLKTALEGAWQKDLNTSEDPANGQWYTNGANNDNIGLYGNLTDAVPAGLTFNDSQLTYLPTQMVIMSALVDNRNGNTPTSNVLLSKTYTDTTTVTHTITNALQAGLSTSLKGTVELPFVAKGEASITFSVSYTFTYSSATSTTTSEATQFSQSVPVTVPSGRLYKVVLTGSADQIQVPFTAYVTVSGSTETWFKDRINGHYNWAANAGQAFAWINQYATAGADSANYGVNPLDPTMGAVLVTGMMSYQTLANFQATTYDVTPTSSNEAKLAVSSPRAVQPGEPVSEGVLINTVTLTQPKKSQATTKAESTATSKTTKAGA